MGRFLALVYGVVCYLAFLGTLLYAIWFVWTLDAPRPDAPPLVRGLLIDASLLALFALQHSGMARQGFKRVWTKVVPLPIERSTYVLFASAALLAVVVFWQPMTAVVWDVQAPAIRMLLSLLFWLAWANLVLTTFLVDHFDLFGLKQVWLFWRGEKYQPPAFKNPAIYKVVRHPIYLSFLVAFWSAPRMTAGHLFFAVMCTGFILVAIQFEERDLVHYYGDQYRAYRDRVSMLIPWPKGKKTDRSATGVAKS